MRHLSTILKIGIAVALITWMVKTGRLDPANLASAFRRWDLLLATAALFYCQIIITGSRWHMLLRSQGIRLPFRDTMALNFIGTLFNTVIPGAVGGDVMKGYYLSRRAPGQRSLAITTLLVDRVLGLMALLVMPLIAAAWNMDLVLRSKALRAVMILAAAGLFAGVAGFFLALMLGNRLLAMLDRLDRFRPAQVLRKVLWAIVQYRNHAATIAAGLALGMLNHLLGIYAFLLCARSISDADLNLQQCLLVVPLGLVTTAIPISPAGVGVGQAAFFTLFALIPGLTGQLGSEACTVYQFVMVAVFLTGFGAYVFYRDEAAATTAVSATTTEPAA